MHPNFQQLLEQATHLTRRGDLQAATRSIQQALLHPEGGQFHADDVIDVAAREVPDAERAGLPSPNQPESSDAGDRDTESDLPESDCRAPIPADQGFVHGRHGGVGLAGRDYKLFIPPGDPAGQAPLVVMLHGCTQDPDDFAAGTRMNELASARGFFVLYPAQSQRANPQRCWSWFKPNHQARGRGEPELLAGMVRAVMARHRIDPDRVYVAGLSAGGAMAAILGGAYPELFAAVGVHSGLAPGAARDVRSAFEAMKNGARGQPNAISRPTIVFHGDADRTVHPDNAVHLVEAAGHAQGTRTESEQLDPGGGRKVTRQVHRHPASVGTVEHWLVHGAPHAWSGGSARGSYTDPQGPDASAEMLRFFLEHPRTT